MPRRSLLLLALAGAAACSATPPPPPPSPVVEMPPIVAEPPPPDPTQALTLPRSPVRPPWREDPVAAPLSPLARVKLVEAGQKAALVRTAAGELFALQEDGRALGPIPTAPGAKWIGTDDQDRVYVATPAGELWVAESPEDAAQGKLARAGAVEGATDWDFAPGILAAVQGEKVFVSTDRGATFTASSPRKGTKARWVFTRFDGTVAVRLQGKGSRNGDVVLSRDRGKTWQRSAFTPDGMRRDGAWIWSGAGACPAVLTADGRGFTVDQAAHRDFDALATWTEMFLATEKPRDPPPGPRLHVTSPLPPASSTGKGRQDPRRCQQEEVAAVFTVSNGPIEGGVIGGVLSSWPGNGLGNGLGRGTDRGELKLGTAERACPGASCLAGTVDRMPAATRSGLGFLAGRAPQVARLDRVSGQVRVGDLPPGCDPAAIHSAGGLGLLLCKSGAQATAIFTSPPGGAWSPEGTIPAPAADLWGTTLSPDGSLMLHATCPRGVPCRVMIRAPRPPGDASAWRTLAVADALAYRILDDGAALVIAPGSKPQRFTLLLAKPGAEAKPPAPEIDAGERQIHELRIDQEGRVVVSGALPGRREESWLVSAAGTLLPGPPPEPQRRGVSLPVDPARRP